MNKRLKEVLIRLLYVIPLLLFTTELFYSLDSLNSTTSFGIKYKYAFIIPIFIFAYQSIRNSKLGWLLVLSLYLTFLTIWVIRLIEAFSMVGAKFTYGQYLLFWVFVLLYLGIGFVYYKFRPKTILF